MASGMATARTLSLTKALDSTRPAVSNDGWDQIDTDIIAIHDYEASGKVLAERYGSKNAIETMIAGFGPAGRKLVLSSTREDPPIMFTEFGGVSFSLNDDGKSWG